MLNTYPVKTVMENTVIARPLSLLLNISAKTAPTQVNGQAPKNPPKKREMKIVWTSLPVAAAIEKIEKPKDEMISGILLPYNSLAGAHIIGPVANPRTYSDTPRIPTSREIPYCVAMVPVATENIEDPNAAVRVTYPRIIAVGSFFLKGQFCACNGSCSPSNSTTYSSLSGNGGGKGFPPPKLGKGILESLSAVRLLRLVPMVCACWLRPVWMRLSAVGCLSRSRCVGMRDMLVSVGWMEVRLLEVSELDVLAVTVRDSFSLCSTFSSRVITRSN